MIRLILAAAPRLKPLLVRFIPRRILRRLKQRVVSKANNELEIAAPKPFDRNAYPDGVNLVGPLTSVMGLGQSSRIIAGALEYTCIPLALIDHQPLSAQKFTDTAYADKRTDKPKYSVNIIHINPHELPFAYLQLGREVFDGRYNIMFWLWESGEFPEDWLPALNLADEIWTPSEFSGAAVRKATDKPVTVMPYYIEVPINENIDRDYFKLPEDQTLFLCSYDSGSVRFRKNPDGVINAYKRAFPSERPDCGIVIKVGGAPKEEVRELKAELSAYRNVYFITDYLSRVDMNSLIACCDAYISLHRAEGFGLVCAEAMYLGKPVVATNWSANTEFMNSGNACLVDYELKPLEEAIGPFKAGTMWAEPDAAQAAMCVRRVYEDAGYRAAIGSAAAESIRRELNIEKSARAVRTRLTQLIRGQLCRGVG